MQTVFMIIGIIVAVIVGIGVIIAVLIGLAFMIEVLRIRRARNAHQRTLKSGNGLG